MQKMTRRTFGASSLALMLAGSASFAQQARPVRVRGTVESASGNVIMVKSRDGSDLKLVLKDNATVRAVIPAKMTDIKAGTNVGITSAPQADGSLSAIEVHIFPANQNINSAHFDWDLMPNTFMTNGPVQTSVAAVDGQVLTVQYKSGDKVDEKQIKITPKTAIVGYEPSSKDALKPGVKVFVAAAPKLPDGSLDVANISYGKDGMTPPM
ncbi:MAG TPA: hypothetical protein VKW08_01415 [Xanthobacteraceae bacterium]|nr:hypothetical protein [Xanthobacteraceae bacterium]